MQAQYELLSQMAKSGQTLNVLQDFFVKFYQAFIVADRWQQYIKGVGTTLLVTAMALALGVVLGSVVAMIRVAHDQQKPHHRNPVLGIFNAVAKVYATIIRGGLMAVDPGQMEAGRSLGLNYMTTMFEIIIPQAIRSILPSLGNEFIMLLKDSSLITVIGGKELLYAAQGIMNRT